MLRNPSIGQLMPYLAKLARRGNYDAGTN